MVILTYKCGCVKRIRAPESRQISRYSINGEVNLRGLLQARQTQGVTHET